MTINFDLSKIPERMNIKLMTKGAKSLVIPRAYPRPKSAEELHYLVWNSVGRALYDAIGDYEQEQEEKEHSASSRK